MTFSPDHDGITEVFGMSKSTIPYQLVLANEDLKSEFIIVTQAISKLRQVHGSYLILRNRGQVTASDPKKARRKALNKVRVLSFTTIIISSSSSSRSLPAPPGKRILSTSEASSKASLKGMRRCGTESV